VTNASATLVCPRRCIREKDRKKTTSVPQERRSMRAKIASLTVWVWQSITSLLSGVKGMPAPDRPGQKRRAPQDALHLPKRFGLLRESSCQGRPHERCRLPVLRILYTRGNFAVNVLGPLVEMSRIPDCSVHVNACASSNANRILEPLKKR
jgi:hypothetical protein